MNYRFSSIIDSIKIVYPPMKYPLALTLAIASCQTYAAPADMGKFKITSRDSSGGATGTYRTSNQATGVFTITRDDSMTRGYGGTTFIPGTNNSEGINGIEIRNDVDLDVANDKFTYTFAITPSDNASIHTIKIGQASYTTTGNSEVARHTLNFTKNSLNSQPVVATVKSNEGVPYYYEAMGDYFMGEREGTTSNFTYNNSINSPQLRENNDSKLYFYRLDLLNGTRLTGTRRFSPSTNNGNVSVRNGSSGFLPTPATFTNILKSKSTNPNNQTTYPTLTSNIPNGGQYISYGIENSASSYVVAVKNASSVTLTYEGIMNGSNGFEGEKIGETYIEWISFGVESEPVYNFSGTVFNDNGGINDNDSNANKDNATINSGIYNNTRFFNALFEPAPASPAETGINGSTVQLTDDCTTTTPTVYATTVIPDADSGRYQFIILPSVLSSRTSVCLIETRTNSNDVSYPIRTTTNKRTVNLVGNTFNYSGNDFGRVIAKNAALVLEKEQAVNNCKIGSLTDASLSYSKLPLSSSDNGVGATIRPGQCIAYKVTATNRANLDITSFTMTDILQSTTNGASVTSYLSNPVHSANDYAGDSVAIGANGTVRTNASGLNKRTKRSFYFNTRYGSTNSNP